MARLTNFKKNLTLLSQVILLLLPLLIVFPSYSQFTTTAFWKKRSQTLSFSTSTQTIPAKTCSGITTVQAKNSSGLIANVSSNLTVNLTGTGSVTFYSDSDCTTTISSITIASGSSSASFYFLDNSVETTLLTATATDYIETAQSATISTNGYVWTGGGGNSLWSNGANWSGGSAPGTSNVAVFDGTCSSNCSPTLNANMDVGGVRMAAGYTGTITQSAAYTIDARTLGGWVQLAGNFVGGTGVIRVYGNFTLLGGSFSSTSGTLTQNKSWTVGPSATFNANSGTLAVVGTWYESIKVSNEVYNNVKFSIAGNMTLTGTMNVAGTLTANQAYCCQWINGGTIVALGNVNLTGYGFASSGGTILVRVAGSGTQTITGDGVPAGFPNLTIASTGAVIFGGTFKIMGDYTFTSGTLNAVSSTFVVASEVGKTVTVGSESYDNVTFSLGGTTTLVGTMKVAGTLTAAQSYCCQNLNGGTIEALGNITTSGYGFSSGGGTTVVKIAGSVTQTVSGSHPGSIPNLTIASTGGSVIFSGTMAVKNATNITSGATSLASSADTLKTTSLSLNGNTLTKNGGTLTVNGTNAGTGTLYGGTVNP